MILVIRFVMVCRTVVVSVFQDLLKIFKKNLEFDFQNSIQKNPKAQNTRFWCSAASRRVFFRRNPLKNTGHSRRGFDELQCFFI